jgi:hypothetical protein
LNPQHQQRMPNKRTTDNSGASHPRV